MKKWLVLALIVCVAGVVRAGEKAEKKGGEKEKGITKEQFLANQKKNAEQKGVEFDQAAAEARFDKRDTNKDGVLSADERGKGKAKAPGQDKDKDKGKKKGNGEDQTITE